MSKFDDFKNKYLGKKVDVDGMYGGQCVDLFNAWNRDYNKCYINCQPSGYAKSLAENKNNNGILKYFKETSKDNLVKGTVVVWGNSTTTPKSHVGFFIKDNGNGTFQAFHQNVGGKQYALISNISYKGVIGYFIPNQLYVKNEFFNSKGYFSLGDTHVNIGKIASFMYKTFPKYTDKKALGNYYGQYIKASITEFQKRTGLVTDGCIGKITLNELKKYGFKG